MSVPFFKYLYLASRFSKRRDFLDMGFGIAERAHRFAKEWQPHFENTKGFVKESSELIPSIKNIVILGAGRLLDLDISWLKGRHKQITCYDLDPEAARIIRKNHGFEYKELDLTGCLVSWIRALKSGVKPENLVAVLPELSIDPDSHLVSLNLLGQIPIYWRSRALKTDRTLLADQSEMIRTYQILQEKHLELLNSSGAKLVTLITDTAYKVISNKTKETAPALFCREPAVALSNYRLALSSNWDWQVVPLNGEVLAESELHHVSGQGFVLED